jgi:RNA polymerase sigma factor CnrH
LKDKPAMVDEDHAWATSAAGGDRAAFGRLMRRWEHPVHRIARRWCGEASEAEDIAQTVFSSFWTALQSGRIPANVGAFLRRSCLNACRDWSRRRSVRAFFFRADPIEGREHSLANPIGDQSSPSSESLLDELDRAIAALPEGLKGPLILCALDGLSQREAGDVLGLSAKAIENRIARARQQLKARLQNRS